MMPPPSSSVAGGGADVPECHLKAIENVFVDEVSLEDLVVSSKTPEEEKVIENLNSLSLNPSDTSFTDTEGTTSECESTDIESVDTASDYLTSNTDTDSQKDDNDSTADDTHALTKSSRENGRIRNFGNSIKKNMSSMAKKIRAPIDMVRKNSKSKKVDLSGVKINKLPQLFVVKYLGKKKCKELIGLNQTRKPVDEMMKGIIKKMEASNCLELPLLYLIVSTKGLHIREHSMNKIKNVEYPGNNIPLEMISYGVQDIKYWRVFTFILVKELSSRAKVAECHAFLCDSPVSARKLTISLGAAFKLHMKKLKSEGKDKSQFLVELRTPEELEFSQASEEDYDVWQTALEFW